MEESEETRIDNLQAEPQLNPLYLVVHRGDALLEVVQLPNQGRIRIGRASSNRVVLEDPKCSREHCEIYHRGQHWLVRDLDSRNGLTIDERRVTDDHVLQLGESLRIGQCSMLFTDKHPDDTNATSLDRSGITNDSGFQIIERQAGTQFDNPSLQRIQNRTEGAAELFHIARLMVAPTTVEELSEVVLGGLLAFSGASMGGVLLGVGQNSPSQYSDLKPFALNGCEDARRLSSFLSQIVLDDKDAILAHDITKHSSLSAQDSLQALAADSAICAPIRHHQRLFGVIHLYSWNASDAMNQSHLEFILAVADQMGDHLNTLLEKAELVVGLEKSRLQITELQGQLGEETELVGSSQKLEAVRRSIARVAPTDALVLIRGESGVGKELVARAVHFNSNRKEMPFVCVNCAALTESLLESELFGHEKGAFTGAASRREGKFEQADKGTLFLDEIGEMSPEIQAKFLRVLEGQAFERVGGGESVQVDVRVVTATNRDLEVAVREGTFRRDLFFRLQVIELTVPPLRERPDDISAIAQHFVQRFSSKSNSKIKGFCTPAIQKLKSHPWPGNVRELRNVVERAVILSDNEILQPEDIVLTTLRLEEEATGLVTPVLSATVKEESVETSVDPMVDLFGSFIQREISLDDIDRYYIEAVLDSTGWNKSKASRILQIERTTLDRRLKKYGISRPDDAEDEEE
ncbi:sigma 54-interacting transcriptional regulator [Planctomicrobium sp.]|jgi:transcriptional regulator with GAF, ATPase, and Fis domain|nr:sigma 54-interacting transcriptional regulator [Planctomicrobium sp.]MBT5020203.1 sigma 54-interacting transcriptional regulator [Planctomicrobium sp.]MDB4743549.1 sigma 54-interacting transcriptional regulator [Planctomicrobium sp.]